MGNKSGEASGTDTALPRSPKTHARLPGAMSRGRKTNRGGNCEWYTPRAILHQLEHEFGAFELDPAALNRDVAVAPKFYTPEENGLYQPWAPQRVFLNPPYGDRTIGLWMDKAL